MPKVLVLLAAHNGAPWIREQLESILAQREVEAFVAIRDDASTDETLEEIARCQAGERLALSPGRERTGSAAQNFLELVRQHSAAGFDFVALADQDDIWHPQKLQRGCSELTHSGGSGYSSATLATWADGRTVLLRQNGSPTRGDFLFEGAGQGCTFVLRVDFYARIRRFVIEHPELTARIHYHDWMIYALARSWGEAWRFDPWPSVSYRQHGGNDTGARGSWAAARKRLALMRSGWYREQLEAVAAVCEAAAPENRALAQWSALLRDRTASVRRLRIARFCLSFGRRKRRDNLALTLAALAGWI